MGNRWPVRLAGLAGAVMLALLSGCYLPDQFKAEVRISRSGAFGMMFLGDLIYAPLHADIKKGKIAPDEVPAKVETLIRDLQRDRGYAGTAEGGEAPPHFRKIEHLGMGRFRVHYERVGHVDYTPLATFVRRNARILSVRKKDNLIVVQGAALSGSQAQQVTALGLDVKGEFRVTTDAPAKSHNANEVRTNGPFWVYIWHIDSLLAPTPRLVLDYVPQSS